jgi:uncharacterized protein
LKATTLTRNFYHGLAVVIAITLFGCASQNRTVLTPTEKLNVEAFHCGEQWMTEVDDLLISGDGSGHGPDLGSQEWQSVIEFKLGVRSYSDKPDRSTQDWCRYIDEHLKQHTLHTPSFACNEVRAGSMEAVICDSAALSRLDRRLNSVYKKIVKEPHSKQLKAEQRGWIKGRNACWKSSDSTHCLKQSYIHRIAELEARFALVTSSGHTTYLCNDKLLSVFYYDTQPPSIVAEFNDSEKLMFIDNSASDTHYRGGDYHLKVQSNVAILTWGYYQQPIQCKVTVD